MCKFTNVRRVNQGREKSYLLNVNLNLGQEEKMVKSVSLYTTTLTIFLMLAIPCVRGAGFAGESLKDASVQYSKVKFRDDFNTLNPREWKLKEYTDGVSVKNGILVLNTPGTPSKTIRMTSAREFIYAVLKTRVRFSAVGKPTNHYLGFMTRDSWDDANNRQSLWLMDSCVKRFELWRGKEGKHIPPMLSPEIQANKWYDIEIRWSKRSIEFSINGIMVGKTRNDIPDASMPMVFDLFNFENKPLTMEVDFVEIDGTEVITPELSLQSADMPPVKPTIHPEPVKNMPPRISEKNNTICLENRFFSYTIDLKNPIGPVIKSIRNRYLPANQQEMLDRPSRLLLLHKGVENCRNINFSVVSRKVNGNSLTLTLENREVPGLHVILTMTVSDSPELSCQAELKNCSKKELISSVSYPILEHLKIGQNVHDDAFFYPSETGFCGMADFDLRGIYGYSLWMPLMAVFDPAVGGGIYSLAKISDGMPAVMMVRRNSRPGKNPPLYNEIWWQSQSPKNFFTRNIGSSMVFKPLEFQLNPGTTAKTAEVSLGVSTGDWHQPLAAYSKFLRTYFKHNADTPQWYRDSFVFGSGHDTGGLHMMSYKNNLGTMDGGFWDPETNTYCYAEQMRAGEKDYVMEFCFWNTYGCAPEDKWCDPGSIGDNHKPGDWSFNEARGGLQAFKEEIDAIHRKQGRLMLYFYQELVNKSTETFKKHGMKYAAMSQPGKYAPRYGNAENLVNYCPLEEGVRDYFSELFADRVGSSGADGGRLDVLSYQFPCFNPAHKHYNGTFRSAFSPKDVNAMIAACRKRLREKNPQGVVTTEHAGNDYLLTENSGFFAQTKCWFDIPEFKRFRPFNQYRLNFLRFVMPEIKGPMSGLPLDIQTATAIFNAAGIVCGEPDAARAMANLREISDVLNSGLMPEPYIDTLQEKLYCNFFPGNGRNAWSFYNRSEQDFNGQEFIKFQVKPGYHYVDVISDTPAKITRIDDGKALMSVPLNREKAAMVAEFPCLLSGSIQNNRLTVSITAPVSADHRVKIIRHGHDIPGMGEEKAVAGNTVVFELPDGNEKIIVKLFNANYLADEIIITR